MSARLTWVDRIGVVESERTVQGKTSVEMRYYISSRALDAKSCAYAVRGHWGIENCLHWVLDVAFDEDQCRVRKDSQTLLEEITVEGGKVQQSNFPNYPVLPPSRMPEVAVQIIESGEAIGGIGEPGTPPIAVAVLTGERIHDLLLRKHKLVVS